MLTGHASHQIGLDADIWLTPMPRRGSQPRGARGNVGDRRWCARTGSTSTRGSGPATRRRSSARRRSEGGATHFVNAAIKKALCREAGSDRDWLNKVRPMWGHDYHFHIRLHCPPAETCDRQDPVPPGDGCDQLGWWFTDAVLHPRRDPNASRNPA